MYCTKCGKQIEDDSKFCIYCGCEVEEEQQSKPVKNNKKKNQSSSILGVLIVVGIPIFIGVAILVINTIVHSFDPMKYEIKDFIKVASEPQFRRTDYTQTNNTAPAPKKVTKVVPVQKPQVQKAVTQIPQPTPVASTNIQQNNNSAVDDFMN